MASYLHRTATTSYPCCIPALGDSEGAGRVGLAGAKISNYLFCMQENSKIFFDFFTAYSFRFNIGTNRK